MIKNSTGDTARRVFKPRKKEHKEPTRSVFKPYFKD